MKCSLIVKAEEPEGDYGAMSIFDVVSYDDSLLGFFQLLASFL